MDNIFIFDVEISAWIYAPVVYLLWVSILLVCKKLAFNRIKRWVGRTKTQLDDVLMNALNLPLTLLIFVSGIFILEGISPLSENAELTKYFFIAFRATAIVAAIIFTDRLLRGLTQSYSSKVDVLKSSGGVAQGIVRIIVIGLGLMILLDSFGVSITPLIASLGIGSLAVALALQPTLENFFSGVQIMIDKPIMVGHFIKLESGEQGYVQKIGWRSSWVRMLQNNTVVIPNKLLVNSRVTNYYYPKQVMSVLVQVGVHYDSDLDHVEKVTIETGEEIMKTVDGGVPEFKPFIRYHTFNSSSIDFSVILRCREYVDSYRIKHEFIKKLHKRYNEEGIVIPFPIRAVNFSQEKVQKE
jgi:small-conductance mechanosensitive channel